MRARISLREFPRVLPISGYVFQVSESANRGQATVYGLLERNSGFGRRVKDGTANRRHGLYFYATVPINGLTSNVCAIN